MDHKIDWQYLFSETRARVYLVWAVLVPAGFIATHFYQRQQINGAWFLISLIGLGYMFKVMPLKVRQMRNIFLAWALPITLGLFVSGAVFYYQLDPRAVTLMVNLGAFWLLVMALGYFLNGLVDAPSGWYWFAAGLNLVAAALCFTVDEFSSGQYLIVAVVSAWSMLYLWLFRADA